MDNNTKNILFGIILGIIATVIITHFLSGIYCDISINPIGTLIGGDNWFIDTINMDYNLLEGL